MIWTRGQVQGILLSLHWESAPIPRILGLLSVVLHATVSENIENPVRACQPTDHWMQLCEIYDRPPAARPEKREHLAIWGRHELANSPAQRGSSHQSAAEHRQCDARPYQPAIEMLISFDLGCD